MLSNLWLDLRHAARSLRLRPGFSLLVLLTLALGTGTVVAVFQYLAYFLWPTVQAPEPHRVVSVDCSTPEEPGRGFSYPDWRDLRADQEADEAVFSRLAAYRLFGAAVATGERTLHAWGTAVDGDYFELFAWPPQLGRLLGPADLRPGAERVVVLNDPFWRRHFGADPEVLGRTLVIDGRHGYTIVGVTQPGFQGIGIATGIYVPMATSGELLPQLEERINRRVWVYGRLGDGVSEQQAAAALQPLLQGLDAAYPEEEARGLRLEPVTEADDYSGDPLLHGATMMMAAVALLFALACANVANLFLARGALRRRELSVMTALGVGRLRLGRRLLFESLLLCAGGGVLGLVVAAQIQEVIHRYLLETVPVGFGEWAMGSSIVTQSWRLALVFVAVTAGTGVLFGLVPWLQTLRTDLVTSLKAISGDGHRRRFGSRQLLVVAQVALSAMLLLAAALLVRTLWNARGMDLGFEPAGVTVAALHVPHQGGAGADGSDREGPPQATADRWAVYEDLLERTRRLPGVSSVSLTRRVPLSFLGPGVAVAAPATGERVMVGENVVSEGLFATLGILVLLGRDFDAGDVAGAPPVAVVNRTFAERFFPGESPLGRQLDLRRIDSAADEPVQVVGVVADHRVLPPSEPIEPVLYVPFRQRPYTRLMVLARSQVPVGEAFLRELHAAHPDVAVIDLLPLAEQIRRATADQRMNADLAGGFGGFGLLLAALGIFSVASYGVARRGRELGIRMAVGADAGRIRRLVLGEMGVLVLIGLVLGMAGAVAFNKVLASLLLGVAPHDPATAVTVLALLAAVAFLAAWLPARRASRTDPMTVLRQE